MESPFPDFIEDFTPSGVNLVNWVSGGEAASTGFPDYVFVLEHPPHLHNAVGTCSTREALG